MQPQPPQPHHHQCRLFVCVCPTVPVTIVVVAPLIPAPPTCNRIRIRNRIRKRIRNRIRQCKHQTVASLHHYLCVSVTPEIPKPQANILKKTKKPASLESNLTKKKWSKSQIFRSRSLPNSITHQNPIQLPPIQAISFAVSLFLSRFWSLSCFYNPPTHIAHILHYPCQNTFPSPLKSVSAFLFSHIHESNKKPIHEL